MATAQFALSLVLSLFALGACSSPPVAAPQADFDRTVWLLETLAQQPVDGGTRGAPQLRLDRSRSRVNGFTGCNRFSAPLTLNGNALSLGTVAASRQACAEPLAALEQDFLAMLARVSHYRLHGDQLWLLHGEQTLARFKAGPLIVE